MTGRPVADMGDKELLDELVNNAVWRAPGGPVGSASREFVESRQWTLLHEILRRMGR